MINLIRLFTVSTATLGGVIAAPAARAATPTQCVIAYADHARAMASFANKMGWAGNALQLGATFAASSSLINPGPSTLGTIGGSAVGSTADAGAVKAQFASNMAQAVAEAQGHVIGPFTGRLAGDLNDAVYESGRFGRMSNPLDAGERAAMRTSLSGRRVNAVDVGAATTHFITEGSLCDSSGEPLDQNAWATLIVGYIANGRPI